jgi:hypothetical protein
MGYTEKDSSVRIDRFKDGGKWYDTFAVDMEPFWDSLTPVDGVRYAIAAHPDWSAEYVQDCLDRGFTFVCLEPYHKYAYPVMLKK